MAKKKIYAVRKGHKTGLFYTWDECKKQVNGFSGAEYKSFQTLDEAYKNTLLAVLFYLKMEELLSEAGMERSRSY